MNSKLLSGACLALPFCVAVISAAPAAFAAAAPTSTTLTVTAAGSPATSVALGTVITLTATVTSSGAPVNPGQVNFCDAAVTYCSDIHLFGTAQLTSAGTAIVRFRPRVGSHSYKAVLVGNTGYLTSSSGVVVINVPPPAGYATVSSALVSSATGPGDYFLRGNVYANGPVPLTGTVSFLDASKSDALLGTSTFGYNSTYLNPLPTLYSGSKPFGGINQLITEDFNGDGIPDLAVLDGFGNNALVVLLGNGDGSFTQSTSITIPASFSQMVSADFNGDGIPDLAVTVNVTSESTQAEAGYIEILLGNGNGTFTPSSETPATGKAPYAVTAADFDLDGNVDLAIPNADGTLTVLLGNGAGAFRSVPNPENLGAGGSANGVIGTADFDRDGIPDLVLASTDASGTSQLIMVGNGDGTFRVVSGKPLRATSSLPSNGTNQNGPALLAIADFNGDGISDIIIGFSYYGSYLFFGNGDATFTQITPERTPLAYFYDSVAVADINGDGIPDAVFGIGGLASINYGTGQGTFSYVGAANFQGEATAFIAVADFNGDGVPDVAAGDASSLSVLQTEMRYASATATGIAVLPAGSGPHSVIASYSGDNTYAPSTSAPVTLTAVQGSPTVTLASTAGTSSYGTAISFIATVSGAGLVPTGQVTFDDGITTFLATTKLTDGTTTYTTTTLAPGSHSITARYLGDSNYTEPAATAPVALTVTQAAQIISFSAPASTELGISPITLHATGGASPNPVVFSIVSGPGQLSGTNNSVLTITGTGTIVIAANQAGNTDYTAAPQVTASIVVNPIAVMASPASSAVLPGPSVTFTWIAAPTATSYYLWIGTTGVGSNNLYNSAAKTTTTYTFANMPTNGETIYVRLISNFNGTWLSNDYTYTAATQSALTSPVQGSTLTGPSAAFTWTAAQGASGYYLQIGSTGAGSDNIYNSTLKTATTYTITNLPANGETLYVRLITSFNGALVHSDYTYTAAMQAALISPAKGSAFTGSSVTFDWTAAANATSYYLWIGSTGVGSNNIYNSAAKTATTYTFTQMPTDNETINVRLITNFSGTWTYADYTFKAAALPAAMTAPTNNSILSSPYATFTWTPIPSVTGYYLWIGTNGVGSNNLYNSAEKTVNTYTFSGLQLDGETVYVRLITNYSGTWVYNDYTYTAATPSTLTAPAPGSTFAGASVTFDWTAIPSATGYFLHIGSTGPGSEDIYNSAEKTGTTYTFPYMPTNGELIYVRLITNFNGTWIYNDYEYTAFTPPTGP